MRSRILLSCLGSVLCAGACSDEIGVPRELAVAAQRAPLVYPTQTLPVRFLRDRIGQTGNQEYLEVDLVTSGLGSGTSVGIHAATDGGAWIDLAATLVGPLDGKRELWRVRKPVSAGWRTVDFAVFARDGQAGPWYWDNNNQHNFNIGSAPAVHRVSDAMDHGKFVVELDVPNLAYQKSCMAVLTSDDWINTIQPAASYVGPTDRTGYERWRIEVTENPYRFDLTAPAFEYAVGCQIKDTFFWDNNNRQNYRLEQAPPPTLAWETRFDGAQKVAVADDGTTFVVSSERWLSGYGPTGRWRFAKDVGFVGAMTWLSTPGLLLLRGESGWTAVDTNGAILWTSTAELAELSQQAGGSYLVGRAGGAHVRRAGLTVLGPQGGCDVSTASASVLTPVVSPNGTLYCVDTTQAIVGVDLKTGAAKPRIMAAGSPWAVTDQGIVVVLNSTNSTLTAYDAKGTLLWTHSEPVIEPSNRYGWGTVCANHSAGGVAMYLRTDPSNYADGRTFVTLDVATGKERSRIPALHDLSTSPCPLADGNFWSEASPYKYGWSKGRFLQNGQFEQFTVGPNAAIFTVAQDGLVAARPWAYYPADAGTITVSGPQGTKLFSKSFHGAAWQHLAAALGTHVVVAEPGKLSHYLIER